jgi:alpha-L-rhamnosidase
VSSIHRVNPGNMTSFSHYSLGAVVDWMHRTVAGLAPASPGYRSITVRLIPGGGITSARARHVSPYGPVAVAWSTADGHFQLEVEIPPNTSAEIYLPKSDDVVHVGSGTHTFEVGLAATSIESVKVQAQNVD